MYRWRKLSHDDQAALLKWRQQIKRPWHSPPHPSTGPGRYHITAACYEHECIAGRSADRMQAFCEDLLDRLDSLQVQTIAWCLLPNHYHLLVQVDDLKATIAGLGRLHGRTAFFWNGEDNQRGRRVWAAPADRQIRNEAHYWATVNYIHHNPVKHGWVNRWQDWPYSSATDYLERVGRAEAERIWCAFPVLDSGKGWDD